MPDGIGIGTESPPLKPLAEPCHAFHCVDQLPQDATQLLYGPKLTPYPQTVSSRYV